MPSRTPTLSREILAEAARFALRARLLTRLAPADAADRGLVMPRGAAGRDDQPAAKYDDRATRNIVELFSAVATAPIGPVTAETLFDYHRRLLAGCDVRPCVPIGRFRDTPVAVGGHVGAEAKHVSGMVDALLRWAGDASDSPLPQLPLAGVVLRAITTHLELLTIHPFGDGNGRVARAAEFALLLRGGVPGSLAHELHNHYNEDRSIYLRRLAAAQRGDREVFLRYALRGLNERLERRLAESRRRLGLGRRQMLAAGFTLVELVVVILILGILAGVAAPRIFSAASEAEEAAEKELIRRINEGIAGYYLSRVASGAPEFPSELNAGSGTTDCIAAAPCFDAVLRRGMTDGSWSRAGHNAWLSPTGKTFQYDPATGRFYQTS